MLIACLGWGSLVWDPRGLPVRGIWFTDGPFLPIEFVRESDDKRVTLVILEERSLVRSLWAPLSSANLSEAREALRARECIPKKQFGECIGHWNGEKAKDRTVQRIAEWANGLRIEAVVWTKLPPKFRGKDKTVPSVEDVIAHLERLPHEKRKNAEQYIRSTPKQIDTDYRRAIEAKLGWTCTSEI